MDPKAQCHDTFIATPVAVVAIPVAVVATPVTPVTAAALQWAAADRMQILPGLTFVATVVVAAVAAAVAQSKVTNNMPHCGVCRLSNNNSSSSSSSSTAVVK